MALDDHLRGEAGYMCRIKAGGMPASAPDPEDGISTDVENRLRDRRAKGQVLDWNTLWEVLFPGDETAPGPGKQSQLYLQNSKARRQADTGARI